MTVAWDGDGGRTFDRRVTTTGTLLALMLGMPVHVILVLAGLLAGCAPQASTSTVGGEGPCAERASCLVEECAEQLDALDVCVEAAGLDACDQANLAHSECLATCDDDRLDQADRDASFDLYLCRVEGEGNCEDEGSVCE